MPMTDGLETLKNLRESGVNISSRSQELLSLENSDKRNDFIQEMNEIDLIQCTSITCMGVLKKDSDEIDAVTLLVVGTEAKQVLILPSDPSNSTVLWSLSLPSVPVSFAISGAFDVEWRIMVRIK
jgi:Ciliary BBSome complex subunit 1